MQISQAGMAQISLPRLQGWADIWPRSSAKYQPSLVGAGEISGHTSLLNQHYCTNLANLITYFIVEISSRNLEGLLIGLMQKFWRDQKLKF